MAQSRHKARATDPAIKNMNADTASRAGVRLIDKELRLRLNRTTELDCFFSRAKSKPTANRKARSASITGQPCLCEFHRQSRTVCRWCLAMAILIPHEQCPVGFRSARKTADSCGSTGALANLRGLPRSSDQGNLDSDVVAFVQALAKYAARQDHEAQTKNPKESN
jgi:hypothetical protein